jgi:hypothetical protein
MEGENDVILYSLTLLLNECKLSEFSDVLMSRAKRLK